MNYYDEILDRINELIEKGDKDNAVRMIKNELDMPYVPRDLEEKLSELLRRLDDEEHKRPYVSDEQIESFLFKDEQHQLLAVSALDKKNLRNEIPLCKRFLASKGSANAKALLIDSLIRQEIDHQFLYEDDKRQLFFNPKELQEVTKTECFIGTNKRLTEYYLKEPSKLKLAQQLLYKELLLFLPQIVDRKESKNLAKKIEEFIDQAFA